MRINVPQNVPMQKATVTLNGQDITSAFLADGSARTLTGLVTGLHVGDNDLAVTANGPGFGRPAQHLTLTNYPITGPIRSGPHQTPFICQTRSFVLPDGTTLGTATDANCSAATKINYVYLPAGGTRRSNPLPSTSSLPSDVAKTTTTTGQSVNFIVRVETTTIDRGIYQSAILHDPTTEAAPTWSAPPKVWNHRLIAIEGFGCPGGWYIQGASGGSLSGIAGMDFALLSPARPGEGYALFGNTLQHPSNNCNSVLSGEAAQMGKEHFIESYGVPLYTVSQGCSGGSYGSTQLADELPGLFQGTHNRAPHAPIFAFLNLRSSMLLRFFSSRTELLP